MSRIAKYPIEIPQGVEVDLQPDSIAIKNNKGQFNHLIPKEVLVKLENNVLTFATRKPSQKAIALSGTTRALINNMVKGLTEGFNKKLTLVGVGYRAQVQGQVLNLNLGYSHPIHYDIPEGITIETPSQTEVLVKGVDKQKVGQVAANIRSLRPPEPYKGKGVRYADEVIILKETKKK